MEPVVACDQASTPPANSTTNSSFTLSFLIVIELSIIEHSIPNPDQELNLTNKVALRSSAVEIPQTVLPGKMTCSHTNSRESPQCWVIVYRANGIIRRTAFSASSSL
jgi:hypothetical protein